MPWKGEKNPYLIWLSEVILQQTRVEQGIEYYNKFISKYPTVFSLATANNEDVFKSWEGLGYYSRCRNLLATARKVAFEMNGQFPDSYDGLLKLKGIGTYTASAIASFAFGLPYAVLDGNVYRVLARFFGIETPVDNKNAFALFSTLAAELLDKKNPAAYNQAIMDFGATVCTPKKPSCEACPLSRGCIALKEDKVPELPLKAKRTRRKKRYFNYVLVENESGVFIRKREEKDIWQGLYELVLVESINRNLSGSELNDHLPEYLQGKFNNGTTLIQQLSHQEINSRFFKLKLQGTVKYPGYNLVPHSEVNKLAFPVSIRKYLSGTAPAGSNSFENPD